MKDKIKKLWDKSDIIDNICMLCEYFVMGAIGTLFLGIFLGIPTLFITCAIAWANPDWFGSTEMTTYAIICILFSLPTIVELGWLFFRFERGY